jgi:uncharacterized protein
MNLLLKYRWYLSGLLVALALAGIPYLQKAIVPNNSLSIWFVDDDPALVEYHNFHERFGNDEIVALVLHDENGIFSFNTLNTLRSLTQNLEQISGISRVFSITNVKDLSYTEGSIGYTSVVPDSIPASQTALRSLRTKALRSSIISGRLINEEGTTAMLFVQMNVMDDIDQQRDRIIQDITQVAEKHKGEHAVYLGGIGVIFSGLNLITQQDFKVFILMSYLLMFALIWALYGRAILVLYTMATIGVATVLTLELYGLMGYSINMITMIIPTLVAILGIMDVMHVVNEFYFLRSRKGAEVGSEALTHATLLHVLKPCLFTTLTTMAGFMALTASPIAILKEFGVFASVGLVLALVCSFVFGALFLYNLTPPRRKHPTITLLVPLLNGLLDRIYRYNAFIWVGLIIMVGLLGYGASKVVTDTRTIEYLPNTHRVVTDHHAIEEVWGPYFPLEFTVKPLAGRDTKHPEVIAAMRNFVDEASEHPEIESGFGLYSVYDRVFPMVYGAFWKNMVKSPREINRVTEMAAASDPDLLYQLTDSTFTVARMTLIGHMVSSAQLNRTLANIDSLAITHFAGIADVAPTGYIPLYAHIIDYILLSQKRSFLLAIGLIFTLMLFMLRDLRLTLIAIVPNLFPVLLLLGIMGYMGITLDIATATIAAIVLGFSIDDTIHFIYHYRHHKRLTANAYKAKKMTFQHIGNAIVFTSMVIFLGYMVLLFANVKTVYYFGLLTAISVLGALFAQLVIFPLLLKAFDKQRKRKILKINEA